MDVAECFSLLNNSMEKKLRKGHLRQSLFFNNVLTDFIAGLSKKETFSCEFCEIFKNTFFTEYLWKTTSIHSLLPVLLFLIDIHFYRKSTKMWGFSLLMQYY